VEDPEVIRWLLSALTNPDTPDAEESIRQTVLTGPRHYGAIVGSWGQTDLKNTPQRDPVALVAKLGLEGKALRAFGGGFFSNKNNRFSITYSLDKPQVLTWVTDPLMASYVWSEAKPQGNAAIQKPTSAIAWQEGQWETRGDLGQKTDFFYNFKLLFQIHRAQRNV
jgi:hypothetical protein